MVKSAFGELVNGLEVKPGVFLIGDPTPRPDLGSDRFACLANYNGMLCVVELSIKVIRAVENE